MTADEQVLSLMRVLAPVVEERRHYGLKIEDAEVYARAILTSPAFRAIVAAERAAAWDEGHRTYQQFGPDGCECAAYNENECGCGLYGTNVVTPNPYREVTS